MNFRPKKSLGQNFLKNPRVVEKIISAAQLKGDELVVEVGPGFGVLTKELVKHAGRVIAIEKDKFLYEELRGKAFGCGGWKSGGLMHDSTPLLLETPPAPNALPLNLALINADALEVKPPTEPYFLIANIPYSITSPLLDHFIRENQGNLPIRAVLLVQKEVAQKICAQPPDMNVLALHVQTFGTPKIIATVSKGNFSPQPKVDSAIIRIDFPVCHCEHARSEAECALVTSSCRGGTTKQSTSDYEKLFALIHKGFSHKRKMLRSAFSEELLQKAGIDPTRRAETLSLKEWKSISHYQ